MNFNVLTIFPEMVDSAFSYGVLSRAIANNIISVNAINIRDYAEDKHKMTDDYQYGGGQGLVMKPEPVCKAVFDIKKKKETKVILLDPRGKKFNQDKAESLLNYDDITIICGRYEGVDERIRTLVVDEEISIGDYVLSGGEFAAFCLIDAIARLIPGVLGDEMSPVDESFTTGLLEYPHYTRPAEYEGLKVPGVLTSGHHAEIEKWRRTESLKITLQNRPDLLKNALLSDTDKMILKDLSAKLNDDVKVYVALIHYPMRDKQGDVVATSITNMDLHDISRSCRTFGVLKYYIVTPLEAQMEIAGKVLNHWTEGYGSSYNSNRKKAFENTEIKTSLLEVIDEIERFHGSKPKLVATTAKKVKANTNFEDLKEISKKEPVLIMFGTGWGMTDDLFNMADFVLEPIEGPTNFNHLSVRSAVAIMLDRFNNA